MCIHTVPTHMYAIKTHGPPPRTCQNCMYQADPGSTYTYQPADISACIHAAPALHPLPLTHRRVSQNAVDDRSPALPVIMNIP